MLVFASQYFSSYFCHRSFVKHFPRALDRAHVCMCPHYPEAFAIGRKSLYCTSTTCALVVRPSLTQPECAFVYLFFVYLNICVFVYVYMCVYVEPPPGGKTFPYPAGETGNM